jgi:hypothetical protein
LRFDSFFVVSVVIVFFLPLETFSTSFIFRTTWTLYQRLANTCPDGQCPKKERERRSWCKCWGDGSSIGEIDGGPGYASIVLFKWSQ